MLYAALNSPLRGKCVELSNTLADHIMRASHLETGVLTAELSCPKGAHVSSGRQLQQGITGPSKAYINFGYLRYSEPKPRSDGATTPIMVIHFMWEILFIRDLNR